MLQRPADGFKRRLRADACARGPVRTMEKGEQGFVFIQHDHVRRRRAAVDALQNTSSAPLFRRRAAGVRPPSGAVRPRRSRKASNRVESCPGAVSV